MQHKRQIEPDFELQGPDYDRLLKAYEEYSLETGKGGDLRVYLKTHINNMSLARQVIDWLKAEMPDLSLLRVEDVKAYLKRLTREGYTGWSVRHYHTKLRLLLDRAMELQMIEHNPARQIPTIQPKKAKERIILSEQEARHVLDVSLTYRQYVSGSLPTIVRLGLYAGLRNEEMCWLKWEAIDWKNRIINIGETFCEISRRAWIPKDYESRRLDVKPACIEYLRGEYDRQKKAGLLGPFIVPAGHEKAVHYRGRPLSQTAPQSAFSMMIKSEKLNPKLTVYSLRHTYATMALRNGVDLRTLQQRMGHADLKTTMEYLHYIEPEQRPMDNLPY